MYFKEIETKQNEFKLVGKGINALWNYRKGLGWAIEREGYSQLIDGEMVRQWDIVLNQQHWEELLALTSPPEYSLVIQLSLLIL